MEIEELQILTCVDCRSRHTIFYGSYSMSIFGNRIQNGRSS